MILSSPGKSALTTLVGNYSDSDGDDSPNEKEELAATAASSESVPVVTDASGETKESLFPDILILRFWLSSK